MLIFFIIVIPIIIITSALMYYTLKDIQSFMDKQDEDEQNI